MIGSIILVELLVCGSDGQPLSVISLIFHIKSNSQKITNNLFSFQTLFYSTKYYKRIEKIPFR